MNTHESQPSRPPIHMIDAEAQRLEQLALDIEDRLPQVSEMLLRETGRARLHPAGEIPPGVITMGGTVEFVDERTGKSRTVQLVYPARADVAAGRISILTPVGAGLIGLREGQSILWPDRDGKPRALTIVRVTPAESTAGDAG